MFQFIHAADLHIDSPLRGLASYEGAPAERLRGATRQALVNLIDLAIDRQVQFVILAGDLFDGQWQDMRTGLWTASQFRRLAHQKIAVYLIRGNHDAESKLRHAIRWPDNVHQFSVAAPETFIIPRLNVALHGQGFADQQCQLDLAAGYPPAQPGMFNIGVLHTSFAGSVDHSTYAPTSLDVLLSRDYDYWALGHVHQRSEPPICERPYIAFPGNTQGRHARETEAKGCLLVTVDEAELQSVQFQPTDVARWHKVDVHLQQEADRSQLYEAVRTQLVQCRVAAEGRLAVVRVTIRGACAAHHGLIRQADQEEVVAEIRNLASELDRVWVERIILDTSPPVDLEQLRRGSDLMGELLRSVERLADDPAGLRELAEELEPLWKKGAIPLRSAGKDMEDHDQLRQWLRQAEALLVAHLREATP